MDTLTLAWRNVWRNSRRSGVTIAATSLALFVMILYSGLVTGHLNGMERSIVDLEVGEAQIFAEGYRKSPSLYKKIDDPDAVLARLDAAGYRGSARLLGSGLAAAGESSSGALLRGLDVDRDAAVSKVASKLEAGRWLDPAAPGEVVVGGRLAKSLGVGVGDELVVLSQGADGSTANDLYHVRGIVRGVSDPVDRSTVFMTEAAFRELMVVPEGAHQILVRTAEGADLTTAEAELQALFPALEAKSWKTLNPSLASMVESGRAGMMIMFVIIYIAIGIVLLNATLMSVFERIREFGVLKALGVGPGGVLRLIFAETAIQTAIAVIIGVALAIPANAYLVAVGIDLTSVGNLSIGGITKDSIWRAEVDLGTYTTPILTLTVIVLVAVIYPATRAAFIRPLAAIRHH